MIHRYLPMVLRPVLQFVLIAWVASSACAQNFNQAFGRFGVVGGVSVDAQGTVRDVSAEDRSELLKQLRESIQEPKGKLSEAAPLRMISLSKLQERIAQAISGQQALPDEVLYLAGLQRVEYVFVYPEKNDIVLAGPAEPWVVREDASVVGNKSGRPVLRLEDLLVALRTSEATRNDVISVSIDPTAEGQVRLRQWLAQVGSGNGFDPVAAEPAMKAALGPQIVTLTTVPKTSRMAHVLVAADCAMKRLAMNLEPSPVKGLSSYMEMVRDRGTSQQVNPRWWMATNYDAILHSPDRLAWKITGLGIKTLTEDEMVSSTGDRTSTGKSSQLAQRWAELFTSKFDQLCSVNAALGDLRNVIDLNIVGAMIRGHGLQELAGCDLSLLCGADSSQLETPQWSVPERLTPHCSFIRGRAGWTVSASGGVEINPWQVVSQAAKVDESLNSVHQQAQPVSTAPDSPTWWWN